MAMALDTLFTGADVDWKILATDLSVQRLDHALAGRYGEAEVSALDPLMRAAYLEPLPKGDGPAQYRVAAQLRAHVTFRRLNLVQVPYPMRGPMDAVFCRNVMFYFDASARRGLLAEAERLLKPGGALYIGTAETLGNDSSGGFKRVGNAMFLRGGGR